MRWTDEEIEFLKKNYHILGRKECAEKLNKTLHAISSKANLLGLKYRGPGWKRSDLSGQIFGKLTVVKCHSNPKGRPRWFCLCDCGNSCIVLTQSLIIGRTRSCGCLQKEYTDSTYMGGKYITGTEFSIIKRAAKERNLEFSITIEDIESIYTKQSKKCALSGIDIVFNSRCKQGKIVRGYASVDRIDNNLGYTQDNIQIVHQDVNYAKQCLSQSDFIRLCNLIARKHPVHDDILAGQNVKT